MASGYKLRLPDGSEIGPLNLEELKGWFARGLVGKDSPVLRPGGSRWVPLRDVVRLEDVAPRSAASDDLRAAVRAAASGKPTPASRRAGAQAAQRQTEEPTQRWRVVVAGALLLAGAAGSLFWLLRPERWLPALSEAPWRELALGQLALGLLLVRGWELGRRLARLVLLGAACALFPIAGILVAQKAPLAALAVISSAFVFLVGLAVWLAGGYLPAWQSALRLALVLAGLFGIVRFGFVLEHADAARIREWARPERSLEDVARGARLVLPAGWVALGPAQQLVPAPGGTWAVLAESRLGGRARVALQTVRTPRSAEQTLTRELEARQLHGRDELERSDVVLGGLSGRLARSRFERDGARYLDVTLAARDGGSSWTLSAWIPDDGSTGPARQLEALVSGFSLDGRAAAQEAALLLRLTTDLPFLDLAAAEAVTAGTGAAEHATPRVLRRGLELAGRGSGTLGVGEAQELDRLLASAVGLLSKGEREKLAGYLVRVRAREATSPEEDAVAVPRIKRALLSLPDESLARLQALYEKAIRAGLPAAAPGR